MRTHATKNNGNSPCNEFLERYKFFHIKIFEQVLQMMKNEDEISSNVMEKENKQNLINPHNLSKRSPGCLLWCQKRGILHPAQCHSYCTFSG